MLDHPVELAKSPSCEINSRDKNGKQEKLVSGLDSSEQPSEQQRHQFKLDDSRVRQFGVGLCSNAGRSTWAHLNLPDKAGPSRLNPIEEGRQRRRVSSPNWQADVVVKNCEHESLFGLKGYFSSFVCCFQPT
ncbi:hypothetical protein V6N13_007952 [Hibiscus sabdariffa]